MCTGVNIEKVTTSEKARPYHHGDLRNALVTAAAELAETGGPEAVTVRAAARRVGVTPTAAYRHFTNHEELLDAAQEQAQQTLFAAMGEVLAGLAPEADAVARLSAIGHGYITFAQREPGLFRTAFCSKPEPTGPGEWNAPAFKLLSTVLDELVEIGFTDPAHRPDAEYAAWAAVHGMASLIVDRAVSHLTADERAAAIARTLDLVRFGLATGPNASALLAAAAPVGRTRNG